ncbi:hypothetical protein REPUB_Repub13aG0081800 [Reevesia pubescens]
MEIYENEEAGYMTPRRRTQTAAPPACPPAPRKKQPVYNVKREPPKNGFFQPPDLEALFSIMVPTRREAACV